MSLLTAKREARFGAHQETDQIIELTDLEIYRLEQREQTVQVLSGCAWITSDGKDVIIVRGDEITLDPVDGGSIISSANLRPLVFETHLR
ncbi:MAG: hypothetical protein R3E39_22380 [Anaerolineae bacterium]